MTQWKLKRHRRNSGATIGSRTSVESLERRVLFAAAPTLLADTSVRNDLYAATNFGGAPKLFVDNPVTVGGDTQITFLKFDISSVTSISSAMLALNGSLAGAGDPPITVGVFAVADSSWAEGTGTGKLGVVANGISWDTQPAIGSEISGATAVVSSQKAAIQTFDLTSYLQQQKLLGNSIVSLAIESLTQASDLTAAQKKKAGAGIAQFDSGEKGVAPALEIEASFIPPVAKLTATNIASSAAHEAVVAEYSGPSAIDLGSISAGNLRITGPSVASVGAVSIDSSNPDDVFATYAVNPPNGSSWTHANDGAYTVSLVDQQVKDITGNGAFSVSTSFSVNVPIPDTTPPTAAINVSGITGASLASKQIVVIYKDAGNVAAATIAASNITVRGPSGALAIAGVTKSSSTNALTITATYSVTPLNGGWSYAADGTYQVSLTAGSVTDASGNAAAGMTTSFVVNIPTPADPNDVTFDHGNSVMAPFAAEGTAYLSNGDIVVVGEQTDSASGNSQGVIELFSADGTVAAGFGVNGVLTTPASANEAFHGVLAQGTNFIVAGSGGGFLLQRYNESGQLDATFGTGGSSVTSFGGTSEAAYALTSNTAGAIVAGGTSDGNFAFAECDANGNLVTTFGQSGRQLFDVGSATDVVGSVAFQSNGDLIAAGSTGAQIVVARLNTAGDADATFGSAGLVIVPGLTADASQTTGDHTEGLAIESDDSILVANQTAAKHFGLVHLDANGNLIASFGNNGLATASFGTDDDADAVFVQPGGDIVVAGTTNAAGANAVAAFDPSGAPILGFGLLGDLTLPAPVGSGGGSASANATAFAAQTPDGHLVLGTNGISTSSVVRKLSVAGTKDEDAGTPLGSFSPGARNKLTVSVNNTNVTLSILGGTGQAFLAANGLHLVITAGAPAQRSLSRCGVAPVASRWAM